MEEYVLTADDDVDYLNDHSIPDLLHDLIQSIVSALEARDPYTAKHSLRVGDMVEKACVLMGLSQPMTTTIHMAAHVHDIGKIALPDRVLLRKNRLSADEHCLLKEHPRIGYDILKGCPSLREVARIVLHHHERWDGSGYPDRLAGKAVPLGARIVAICDSVDAMLGKRIASKSISVEECMAEIADGCGSVYDPAIASFILAHWEEIVTPIDFKDTISREQGEGFTLNCTVPLLAGLERTA